MECRWAGGQDGRMTETKHFWIDMLLPVLVVEEWPRSIHKFLNSFLHTRSKFHDFLDWNNCWTVVARLSWRLRRAFINSMNLLQKLGLLQPEPLIKFERSYFRYLLVKAKTSFITGAVEWAIDTGWRGSHLSSIPNHRFSYMLVFCIDIYAILVKGTQSPNLFILEARTGDLIVKSQISITPDYEEATPFWIQVCMWNDMDSGAGLTRHI